jgi:hypothetical protein
VGLFIYIFLVNIRKQTGFYYVDIFLRKCSFSFALLKLGPKTEPHSLPIITIKKANFFDKFHVKATYTIHHVSANKQQQVIIPTEHTAISPPSYPPVWPSFIHATLLLITQQASTQHPNQHRCSSSSLSSSSTTNQEEQIAGPSSEAPVAAVSVGAVPNHFLHPSNSIPFPFLGSLVLISSFRSTDSTGLTCRSDFLGRCQRLPIVLI